LATKAKSDAILLHSLPRMDEIPPDVDITRWSRYWQEAFNGVVMRMALLALVLGQSSRVHSGCARGFCLSRRGIHMQTYLRGRDLIGDLTSPRRKLRLPWMWRST